MDIESFLAENIDDIIRDVIKKNTISNAVDIDDVDDEDDNDNDNHNYNRNKQNKKNTEHTEHDEYEKILIDDEINHHDALNDLDRRQNEFYTKLLNLFMIHFNNKYNKQFHKNNSFLSNIDDKDKDTNDMMELFYDAMSEFDNVDNIVSKNRHDLKSEINDDINEQITNNLCKFMVSTDAKNANNLISNEIGNNTLLEYTTKDDTKKMNYYTSDTFKQLYCLEIDGIEIYSPSLIICLDYLIHRYGDEIYTVNRWVVYTLKDE